MRCTRTSWKKIYSSALHYLGITWFSHDLHSMFLARSCLSQLISVILPCWFSRNSYKMCCMKLQIYGSSLGKIHMISVSGKNYYLETLQRNLELLPHNDFLPDILNLTRVISSDPLHTIIVILYFCP